HLAVVGSTPVAATLSTLAQAIGYRISAVESASDLAHRLEVAVAPQFVVVASMGVDDEAALLTAFAANIPYVALVASPKRSATVLETLTDSGLPEADVARLKAPAGLNIGARTPEEIALSILAEIVTVRATSSTAAIVDSTVHAADADNAA